MFTRDLDDQLWPVVGSGRDILDLPDCQQAVWSTRKPGPRQRVPKPLPRWLHVPMTRPKTVCLPSRNSAGAVVMKNWQLVCERCSGRQLHFNGLAREGMVQTRWCSVQSWPVRRAAGRQGQREGRGGHLVGQSCAPSTAVPDPCASAESSHPLNRSEWEHDKRATGGEVERESSADGRTSNFSP